MTAERTIKGELEKWSSEPKEFGMNNRGSRGLYVEGNWHNIVGKLDELENLSEEFPIGSTVEFTEKENKKGYWDIDGDIKLLEEAAEEKKPKAETEAEAEAEAPAPKSNVAQNIVFGSCFKAAVKLILAWIPKEGVVDLDHTKKKIMEETERYYLALNELKLNLQKRGDW